MKKLLPIFLIVTLSLSKDKQCFAQKYADKEYYLVDSLDLNELNENDKQLIRSSLKKYHAAKAVTSKINALTSICNNMMHEHWSKYQFFQYRLINQVIQSRPPQKTLKPLKGYLANALNNMGFIYQNQGKVKLALEQFLQSLKIREEIEDKYGIAYALNNIGFIYQEQGQTEEALKSYKRSLKIREEIDDKHGAAYSLNNIGHIYHSQGKPKLALEYFFRSLKIRELIKDDYGIAHSYNNIGAVYKNSGESQKAVKYFSKSLKIREDLGDKTGVAESLNKMALV